MDPGHLQRILVELGQPGLLSALDRLSPTDVQTLLLEHAIRRAAKVDAASLLRRYSEDRFSRPAAADPRDMLELDGVALEAASPDFEPIELSPVCPLGTVSALTTVSQNKLVANVRNSEVVADSTNVMALECAVRRKTSDGIVRLCSSHRLLRAQGLVGSASFAHFRVFGYTAAGRDRGDFRFEAEELARLLSTISKTIDALKRAGFMFGGVRISLTPLDPAFKVAAARLDFDFTIDEERQHGRGYYRTACFDIRIADANGEEHSIADGGFTDWTQKLLSNKKERLLIGGLGSERICYLFGPHRKF